MGEAQVNAAALATDYVARMFTAFEEGDMAALRGSFAPGAVVWHNHDEVEQNVDEVCEELGQFCEATTGLTFKDQRIVRQGNLCFVQHILVARLSSGAEFRLPAIMRIELNDGGLVKRIDEYFDGRAHH